MSDNVKEITSANFNQEVLESDLPVLIDFWAEWCGPCKALGPILENIAAEFEGKVSIKKINIDENPSAPANFGVRSIPTMMIFKDGAVADTKIGLSSEADLKNWVNNQL